MAKLLHLQGLRGIAILSVISFHFFPEQFPNGYLGVDLFFVLSGYLMAMMLHRHTTLTLPIVGDFLYRRLKRIIPLYYLIILVTTGIITFCPCSEIGTNLVTAKQSIWLETNINWNKGMDYFEKLGASHDLFTHTWSLCLEMQFYLLFPLLWWAQSRATPNWRMIFLHVISAASFYLYSISDKREAFNSMLCRIWQFCFGNMIFCLEQFKKQSKDEELSIAIGEKQKLWSNDMEKTRSPNWVLASLSLLLLIYAIVTKEHLVDNFARVATTIATVILIHFGRNFIVLENTVLTILGEVSYSWYLVHWPMVTLQKIYGQTMLSDMLIGVAASFVVSVLVHFTIEKSYLSWEKRTVIGVMVLLFLSCFGMHLYISHSRLKECSKAPPLILDYSRMTNAEIKLYNYQLIEHDQYHLMNKGCVFESRFENFEGVCKYENTKNNNNKTLLIIGNSWAANAAPLIFDECSPFFGNIHRAAGSACEVLWTKEGDTYCGLREKMYFETVEKIRPDYLFVVVRYCFMGKIHSESEWAQIMKVASERLRILSSQVKEKIFVLHTFPSIRVTQEMMNDGMDKGITPQWDVHDELGVDIPTAQKKLDELVSNCPKCEQYDYSSKFYINGTFYPYDPEHFVTWWTYAFHLSLPALEKVRPIYTELCERIGKN